MKFTNTILAGAFLLAALSSATPKPDTEIHSTINIPSIGNDHAEEMDEIGVTYD